MAVTISVEGTGSFRGQSSNLGAYSASEQATPVNLADSSGGTGTISFDVVDTNSREGLLLYRDTFTLADGTNGITKGRVTGVREQNDLLAVSADSRLQVLVADRLVPPFNGMLGDLLRSYFALAGITTGIVIDTDLNTRPVTVPGFYGDLWTNLKELCVVQDMEVSLVSGNVVVRKIRQRTADLSRLSDISPSVQERGRSRRVEVAYYNNQYKTNSLVYPAGGWNEEVKVLQVDAGQTIEEELKLDNVSMVSIQQPTCVAYVARSYEGPTSVYAVAGVDGLPIMPAQWEAQGGSLSVALDPENPSVLKIKITGASETKYAPYKIAVTAGPSDTYSSLRIVGTGVFMERKTVTGYTGTPLTETGRDIGITIDSPYVSTLPDAYNALAKAAGYYCGPRYTLSGDATVINRRGDKGSAIAAKFSDFNTKYAGQTFSNFNTLEAGKTFGAWNLTMNQVVEGSFENQAFGNLAGALVPYRRSIFRITDATVTPEGVSFNAEQATLFSDFNTSHYGKKFSDFNAMYAGKTFSDFDIIPLGPEVR